MLKWCKIGPWGGEGEADSSSFSAPCPSRAKFAWNFSFHTVLWREIFRFRHPSPGKRSTRKIFTQISRQISRHLWWERKIEKDFTPHFCCKVAVLTFLLWDHGGGIGRVKRPENQSTTQRAAKGGWKTQERGKHAKDLLPKTVLDPPHPTYDAFPSPCPHLSFSLEEMGTDQTNPIFWSLQNWLCRAHSIVRFQTPPPPQK